MTPDEYCRDKTAKSGSSFYYSFLFLPAKQRQAIMALYAFCREVDDTVDEISDETVARTKLNWWREEINRTFAGAPRHPVGKALLAARAHFDLHPEYFAEIIDGMEMDLNQQRYADFPQLTLYCHRVAGIVGLLSAEIFGYTSRDTVKYAEQLGMALQLTNIIRDVREDAERGRIYLPQELLAQHGVDPTDILALQSSPALIACLRELATKAEQYYQRADDLLPACDRYKQRAGLMMAAIYHTTLDEIAADDFAVMQQRTSLPPLRKLWIAWRTHRQARRAHKAQ
ncbi:MAG: presqualene diphosphate synthase HpnD [Methylococcales bacterium]|nr:presqualene diphosphate synthase HpnD [Methylococcales bacterium]